MTSDERKIANIFSGKTVSFSTDNETLALKDVSFETINGREFIVGLIPSGATTNGWTDGQHGGVEWESVTDFMIFNSEAEYTERLAMSGAE